MFSKAPVNDAYRRERPVQPPCRSFRSRRAAGCRWPGSRSPLLHSDAGATQIRTGEKQLRSHDHGFDELTLVEAVDAGALRALLTDEAEIFEQIFALDSTQSKLWP
jgi:hypothetical protein